MNYEKLFLEFWEQEGKDLHVSNPTRTRDNTARFLKGCNSVEDIEDKIRAI